MDPLTAFFTAVAAVANLITEAMRGQSLELRQKAWERFDRFLDIGHRALVKVLHLDDAPAAPK